ncbi:MAG: exodeoxyribonuclease VII large subunit [Phycisphaerae bacterium]|nr:exodeoxyribonuclease VII large subunit [Phycisphaerae bacterium]
MKRRSRPGSTPPSGTPRLPFDPGRVRGPDAGDVPPQFSPPEAGSVPPLSVSQLTRMVQAAISAALPGDLRVIGEVSNLSRPAGGHLYFTLKDSASEIRCVMWRSAAQSMKFDLSEGIEVVATGSVEVYEPRGQYQLYVRHLTPVGAGALELAFQQLKAKLAREGLFDPARKRMLPKHPRNIAIVTSPTGAAVRDMLQTISRRYPKVHVFLFGVRVQGEGAADEIADAIRRINHSRAALGDIDAIIVGRGGGSIEDLWAFNEEVVARAIHSSKIPVVSAVGHEVDFTIADFVADVRAATPTAAAELVVPTLTGVISELDSLEHRLRQLMLRRVERMRMRLTLVEKSPWFRDPISQVRRMHQRLDDIQGRMRINANRELNRFRSRLHLLESRFGRLRPEALLARQREIFSRAAHRIARAMAQAIRLCEARLRKVELRLATDSPQRILIRDRGRLDSVEAILWRAVRRLVENRRLAISTIEARFEAAGPERVLKRGFSITRRASDGRIILAVSDVGTGDRIITRVADGELNSRVMDSRQGELFDS